MITSKKYDIKDMALAEQGKKNKSLPKQDS